MSDYGKGLFDGRTAPDVIARCRAARKPVIVDPKGADYSRYRGATLVKPNMKEFQEATGVALNPAMAGWEQDAVAGAQRLFSEFGIENLIVTLSEHGMIFIPSSSPSDFVCIPTEARDVLTCPARVIPPSPVWARRWPPEPRCRMLWSCPMWPPAS